MKSSSGAVAKDGADTWNSACIGRPRGGQRHSALQEDRMDRYGATPAQLGEKARRVVPCGCNSPQPATGNCSVWRRDALNVLNFSCLMHWCTRCYPPPAHEIAKEDVKTVNEVEPREPWLSNRESRGTVNEPERRLRAASPLLQQRTTASHGYKITLNPLSYPKLEVEFPQPPAHSTVQDTCFDIRTQTERHGIEQPSGFVIRHSNACISSSLPFTRRLRLFCSSSRRATISSGSLRSSLQ